MDFLIKFAILIAWSIFFAVLMTYPVMWLYNDIAPQMFSSAKQIDFWTAFKLSVMIKFLVPSSSSSSSSK